MAQYYTDKQTINLEDVYDLWSQTEIDTQRR